MSSLLNESIYAFFLLVKQIPVLEEQQNYRLMLAANYSNIGKNNKKSADKILFPLTEKNKYSVSDDGGAGIAQLKALAKR